MLDIILKDIKLMLSDKKALVIIILMPIVLTTILSFALSGSFQEVGSNWTINIGIVKQYNMSEDIDKFIETMSNLSSNTEIENYDVTSLLKNINEFNPEKTFFGDFLGNEDLKEFVNYEIYSEDEAYKLLKEKKINSIIILPENYIFNSLINMVTPFRNNLDIKVIGHPDMTYSFRITNELMKGYNDIISTITISKNIFIEEASYYLEFNDVITGMEDFVSDFDFNSDNFTIIQKNLEKRNYINSFSYYTAAMLAMFILFAASYGGKFILDEKHNKTYYRIQASGKKKRDILLGKFTMMVVIVIIQSIVMILFSSILFGVNWVNPLLIAITILLSALTIGVLGMLISALTLKTNNYKASDAFSSVVVQLLALLGGSYLPLETLPEIFGKIGRYTPNGAVLNSYIKIMEGYNIGDLLPYFTILIGNIVILTIITALVLYGGEENVKHVNA